MVFIKLPFRKRPSNILDLPFTSYDPDTLLPPRIQIGETEVAPFVSIQDLKDHLTLLAAYYALQHSLSNFPRYITRQAREYQRWAQVVQPRSESRRMSDGKSTSLPSSSRNSRSDPVPIPPTILDAVNEAGPSSAPAAMAMPLRTASPEPIAGIPAPPRGARSSASSAHSGSDGGSQILDSEIPTLGVLMCWHTHMLNPRLYAQECEGAYRGLKGKKFPLHQAAEAIRNHTLPDEVDFESEEFEFKYRTTKWDVQDIAAAVQRQMRFVANMQKIGWLEEDVWEGEGEITPLQRGDVRYHAWLDLMHSTANTQFLVPTLDIDLAWHTHQLSGLAYQRDMERVLGWFLGHDDQASDNKVGNGLEKTGKLWKRRFGYTYVF